LGKNLRMVSSEEGAVPEWEECPHPWFFVSVASKGFSKAVSLLSATLARRSISVAAKGLNGMMGSVLDSGRIDPPPVFFVKN
jgi:hypothetical protein